MASVDLDLTRLPSGNAGWHALVDHALSLGDLSEVGWLELKGALPFGKGSRKRSAVVIARTVLGMANRMPDVAEAHLGGHGVLLVGVQGQHVDPAERVDGAELVAAVLPYVGEDGPRWDYNFIDHADGLVLAVTVDPPRWGDRIHACRKDYTDDQTKLAVRDGEVFVRSSGATRPASSNDIINLERRRDQAADRGAVITMGYEGGFDHLDPDNVPDLIRQLIARKADELLDALPREAPRGGSPFSTAGLDALMKSTRFEQDRRSSATFRGQVERWRDTAGEAVPAVAADFIRHYRAAGKLRLTNESTKYLVAVRAQVYFAADVVVLAESDSEYCDHGGEGFRVFQQLPDPPVEWGKDSSLASLYGSVRSPVIPRSAAWRSDVEVEALSDGGYCVTWDVGDLRPRSTESSAERFAIYSGAHAPEVVARFKVTARGVDHVFEGELRIPCAQEPGQGIGWTYRGGDSDSSSI
ncbi:hypothetical protein G6553_01585 [Nocardioides sp. IC4_145]|uniref:hypothetical protein n=1 Tax=Nocardioides sp. IC4_145 TaxID=2714037 RepID=UPI00140C79E8|nr:hypothetical protein [Nocardioides sp. IC4_145]NHC21866.1 hypothetical protein [Nocardioides sp. IC4_145]